MSILIYRDRATACTAAATLLSAGIIENPRCTLGLDCDRDLDPVYRTLAQMTGDGLLDWSDVKTFNLFEHVRADESQSAESRLGSILLDAAGVLPEHRFRPEPDATDWSLVCNRYERQILDAGGLDTVFCAIRADGSVACNLGASELAPVTHVERTANGRVVTVGMMTLMSARRLVCLMTGSDKAEAASKVFSGSILPAVPASYLQLHLNAVFILDEDAAEQIS